MYRDHAWYHTACWQDGARQLANATRQNVIDVVAKLKSATPILSAAAAEGKIKIVGGIYRLDSGKVELVD